MTLFSSLRPKGRDASPRRPGFRIRPTFPLLAPLFVATLVLCAAAEPQAFYVNYSARVPTAPLVAHPLSIVHPSAELDLAAAHRAGNKVLAYLSVGEVASDAPYRAEVLRRGLPFAGHNETWKSDIIDLGDARWPAFLVNDVARPAAARGFDGFFLDTLDSVQLIDASAPDSPRRTAALAGLVATIKQLRAAFPQKQIVINRGLFAFDSLRDSIDGVLVESLFESHDFATKTSRAVPAAETDALLAALRPVTAAGRAVYVLDYADPAQPARADAAAAKIRALGFHAFVSTPTLDGAMLAPLRPVARKICAFYGNLTEVQEDQVKWPADSFISQKLQAPLEWLGYRVDYFRILQSSDLPPLGPEYRAIVIPRGWEIPISVEPAVVDWLIAQRDAGRKIILFGALPFRDPDQRKRLLAALGLAGSGAIIPPPLTVERTLKAENVFDFETSVPPLQVNHTDLRAPAGARRLLTHRGTPPGGAAAIVCDSVFTCEWGGIALDPYVTFRRADFREFWYFDPFAFLTSALGDLDAPAPDATTRDGLRMFMSHIDGDGFSNFSRVEAGKRSAEIVRDRILKKYPFPVTVSIIEAELRGLIRTQRADDAPALQAIARDIFALPHIELASHSFSHPFFWIEGDRTESFYDEQNLDLKIPYDKLDLAREIDGSVQFINDTLAPPGRRVRVFLWSGNCRVPPAALARVRQLGLENVNGGDTLISRRNPTLNVVAPRVMPWGDELQIFAPNQNENVYTNNWRGPLFGTFSHLLETFALTEEPRRLKPANLYYHFYSGDFGASLRALELICDWALAQPLHAVVLSHYARIARDAHETTIYHSGRDRWTILNRGDSRTLRLPSALGSRIDLARSRGITGWKQTRDQIYVHTDGSPVAVLALAPTETTPPLAPRLESSSAEISFRTRTPQRCEFQVADLRPIEVVFAGLPAATALRTVVNGASSSFTTDSHGRLVLKLPARADVALAFTPSSP